MLGNLTNLDIRNQKSYDSVIKLAKFILKNKEITIPKKELNNFTEFLIENKEHATYEGFLEILKFNEEINPGYLNKNLIYSIMNGLNRINMVSGFKIEDNKERIEKTRESSKKIVDYIIESNKDNVELISRLLSKENIDILLNIDGVKTILYINDNITKVDPVVLFKSMNSFNDVKEIISKYPEWLLKEEYKSQEPLWMYMLSSNKSYNMRDSILHFIDVKTGQKIKKSAHGESCIVYMNQFIYNWAVKNNYNDVAKKVNENFSNSFNNLKKSSNITDSDFILFIKSIVKNTPERWFIEDSKNSCAFYNLMNNKSYKINSSLNDLFNGFVKSLISDEKVIKILEKDVSRFYQEIKKCSLNINLFNMLDEKITFKIDSDGNGLLSGAEYKDSFSNIDYLFSKYTTEELLGNEKGQLRISKKIRNSNSENYSNMLCKIFNNINLKEVHPELSKDLIINEFYCRLVINADKSGEELKNINEKSQNLSIKDMPTEKDLLKFEKKNIYYRLGSGMKNRANVLDKYISFRIEIERAYLMNSMSVSSSTNEMNKVKRI